MAKKAFSLSECLITLSIIGILMITMLSLNNYNDQKMAQAKLSQVDSALQAWGKHVVQNNEAGMGAISNITDQTTLVNSLTSYLSTSTEIKPAETFIGADGEIYRNAEKISLSNGAILSVIFVATGPDHIKIGNRIYYKNLYDSNLLVIKVDVPMQHGRKILSEQYGLKGNKLIAMKDLWQ